MINVTPDPNDPPNRIDRSTPIGGVWPVLAAALVLAGSYAFLATQHHAPPDRGVAAAGHAP